MVLPASRPSTRSTQVGFGSFPITKGETLDYPARNVYVESAGDVHFTGEDGVEDTWPVPDHFIIPVAITLIHEDSTADGFHGIK